MSISLLAKQQTVSFNINILLKIKIIKVLSAYEYGEMATPILLKATKGRNNLSEEFTGHIQQKSFGKCILQSSNSKFKDLLQIRFLWYILY